VVSNDSAFSGLSFTDYRRLVQSAPVGKRLPTALYVHLDAVGSLPVELMALLAWIQGQPEVNGAMTDIIKFHTNDFRVSLLNYPGFFDDPHPSLAASTIIQIDQGKVSRRTYENSGNRPILHRKETFLPEDHPRWDEFRALTVAEEACGLFQNASKIGFEKAWASLLKEKGVSFNGYELVIQDEGQKTAESPSPGRSGNRPIHRAKTAISRFGLSRPVQQLLRFGILAEGGSFFDYGCGLGDDVRALRQLGFESSGWDPTHLPESEKAPASVVNLGFVLNVIENPDERVEVLRDAFSLAEHALVVAVQVQQSSESAAQPFRDGFVTGRGTFQRYFTHDEISRLIETTLDTSSVPLAPGIYVVFSDPTETQAFLERKSSRRVDFGLLHQQLFAGKERLAPHYDRTAARRSFYELHKSLLDEYWEEMLRMGRPPGPGEFERYQELETIGLSQAKAKNLHAKLFGKEAFESGFYERNQELIDSYWDRLVEFGKIPKEEEFDRYPELLGIGPSPEQLKNLFLKKKDFDCLEDPFRERHSNLIDDFWQLMVSLGRLPKVDEFDRVPELVRLGLRPKTLHHWFIEDFGHEVFERAVQSRRDDLLVYLALANFRRKVPFRHLPPALQLDMKTIFGSYAKALEMGRSLLFSLGQPGVVEKALDEFGQGQLNEDGLFFHISLLDQLVPILRVLIGCAEILEGGVTEADIIKIHRRSRKVTLLKYDDFERRSFPALEFRTKIDLAAREVFFFDHRDPNDQQLLCGKDLLVSETHPKIKSWRRFQNRLRKILDDSGWWQPRRAELKERLAGEGYDLRLWKMVRNFHRDYECTSGITVEEVADGLDY